MIDWDESSVLVAVFDSRAEADRAASRSYESGTSATGWRSPNGPTRSPR